MLDLSHIPSENGRIQVFTGNTLTAGTNWQTWNKPRGISMVHIYLLGSGGKGGIGAIGANSTAAGGGGGGGGGCCIVMYPAVLLPDTLYLSLALGGVTAAIPSYVTRTPTTPSSTNYNMVVYANGGGIGGNATGATAGTAGVASVALTTTEVSAKGPYYFVIGSYSTKTSTTVGLQGIAGSAGGTIGAGGIVTQVSGKAGIGGTGGGGLPAAAAVGSAGGAIANLTTTLTGNTGGIGGTTATTPPSNGSNGYLVIPPYVRGMSGTGGGSTHGSATGLGLVQASGGNGWYGCGGGGSGGALTGSAPGTPGLGGPALCIITCW